MRPYESYNKLNFTDDAKHYYVCVCDLLWLMLLPSRMNLCTKSLSPETRREIYESKKHSLAFHHLLSIHLSAFLRAN